MTRSMHSRKLLALSAIFAVGVTTQALSAAPIVPSAPLSYTVAGSTYHQDFSGLSYSGTTYAGGLPAEWSMTTRNLATSENPSLFTYSGAATMPGAGSKGYLPSSASTDHSIGFSNLGSSRTYSIILAIQNNTGHAITEYTIAFDAELWGVESGFTGNSLVLSYAVASSSAPDSLNFGTAQAVRTAAANPGSAQVMDGAAGAERVERTFSNVNIAAGDYLFLRWNPQNPDTEPSPTYGVAFGIDDVAFTATAIPEPAAVSVLAAGGLLLLARRRSST